MRPDQFKEFQFHKGAIRTAKVQPFKLPEAISIP